MLKVLVVLPMYGGSLPVGRFCVSALRELGHSVDVFEAPAFYDAYQALETMRVTSDRLDFLQNSYLNVLSQAVLAKVETFEPDLVLALAQAPLSSQALKRLKRDGVATAMWFVEDFRLFTYWRGFAPLYDVFAVIQKEPFFGELAAISQNNALYLPLAAQPDVHRPVQLSKADRATYGAQVSFMGAGYPNRRLAFHQLVRDGFKIWGTEWEGDPVLAPYVQQEGRRVSSEECVKIFNATDVNLNLHSSIQADRIVTGGDFVNPRTFEVAACGAFQLVDKRGLMDECFADGELATFDSLDDLKGKIEHYLANPDERGAVADKGRARVLADHTYARRMETLIAFVAERMEGWPGPARGEDRFGPDFPPELKADIENLLARLNLPPDATFRDVSWAVRQQQGRLSGLETSILFLDEWKKLYGG